MANGQKTLNTGQAGYLKEGGPVDDVMPHHYGTCDIYWMFGDAVYVTAPGNCHLQMTSPVPHALTASRVSVTKAGGLSDAPGAERSPNGKDGDTVTQDFFKIQSSFSVQSITKKFS